MKRNLYLVIGIVIIIFISVVLVISSIFRSNMVLPEQPPLSVLEAVFIKELQGYCDCDVTRGVNPRALSSNKSSVNNGWYFLSFKNIPCANLQDKDSIANVANQVAHKLHLNVLKSEFSYKYKSITVDFECRTSNSETRSEFFEFNINELKK